jgi:quercetin dioxygenase-like cupin family protein
MEFISQAELPYSEIARELVGDDHGVDVTVLVVDAEPGRGAALHRHPYAEIFIVQEGQATFTVAGVERVVGAGEVVIAGAGEPHAFVSSGSGNLRQIDIHCSPRFETEWLEG